LTPTEFLPNWPWAVVKADKDLAKKVQESLTHLPASILKNLKVKKFKPVEDKEFEPIKRYVNP
jgi:hypothetical protein